MVMIASIDKLREKQKYFHEWQLRDKEIVPFFSIQLPINQLDKFINSNIYREKYEEDVEQECCCILIIFLIVSDEKLQNVEFIDNCLKKFKLKVD